MEFSIIETEFLNQKSTVKMVDVEKYMESFKDTIYKRLQRHEDNFQDLVLKVQSLEAIKNEYKRSLRHLEDDGDPLENNTFGLQDVNKVLI